jgi:hypothetical protein
MSVLHRLGHLASGTIDDLLTDPSRLPPQRRKVQREPVAGHVTIAEIKRERCVERDATYIRPPNDVPIRRAPRVIGSTGSAR